MHGANSSATSSHASPLTVPSAGLWHVACQLADMNASTPTLAAAIEHNREAQDTLTNAPVPVMPLIPKPAFFQLHTATHDMSPKRS